MCNVSQTPPSPRGLQFSDIFWQMVQNFKSIFTHLLYVPIYAWLQIFIQLPHFNEVMPY